MTAKRPLSDEASAALDKYAEQFADMLHFMADAMVGRSGKPGYGEIEAADIHSAWQCIILLLGMAHGGCYKDKGTPAALLDTCRDIHAWTYSDEAKPTQADKPEA